MGLTFIAYIVGIIILILGSYVRDRPGATGSYRMVFMISLGMGIMALASSLGMDISGSYLKGIALFLVKVGYAGLFFSAVFFLRLAMCFPYDAKSKFFDVLAWILACAGIYVSVFTDLLIKSFQNSPSGGRAILVTGDIYGPAIIALSAIYALGIVVLFLRALRMKSRIYRLQSDIIIFGTLAYMAVTMAILFFLLGPMPILMPLESLGGLVIILTIYWATSITRLFDVKEVVGSFLGWAIFAIVSGLPVGFAAAWLLSLWDTVSPAVPIVFIPILVFGSLFLFAALSNRFFAAFNLRGDYLKTLEAGLSDIDFSQGRGIVFEKLSELLTTNMKFSDFSFMLEDQEGNLQVAYSTCGAKLVLDRKNSPLEFLVNMNADVLLKTEAIANHNYFAVKGPLLDIFASLKAEAVVILREGFHVIGLIGMGEKKSGSDYTDYDAQVLRRLYAKLFSISFYLKNIAKESILTTVDRELQYSNQIIASIQENIDRIQHPKVDVAHISRSARKLGGDYIDFVKLSPERWFFIVGDVSGKGLNASMSMVILKSIIRTFIKEEKDFSKLIVKANDFIKNTLPRGTFFAGMFGMLDVSRDTLYFVNCGIPVMYMFSPQFNNVMEVQGEGRILGFVKDYKPYLRLRKIALQPGSIIMITTDGIIEAESLRAERFGKERVQRCLNEYKRYPADTLTQLTYNSLENFVSGEINDDVTILTLKYQC